MLIVIVQSKAGCRGACPIPLAGPEFPQQAHPELFGGQKMGEETLRVLNDHRKLYARISADMRAEVHQVRAAIALPKRI